MQAVAGLDIVVRSSVIEHVSRSRQRYRFQREAGGQLFAAIERKNWAVEQATGPRRSDLRSRFGFRPDRAAEQQEIHNRFSGGLHYVGDWHTHPQSNPEPSHTDIESMQAMVSASTHELPGFLMLIVGTSQSLDGLWLSFHLSEGNWVRLQLT